MSQSPGGEPGSIELANEPARNRLKADAVTLPGVLMQSVTSIAPAIAGMFTVPFIVLNAGIAAKEGVELWRGEECDCHTIPGLDTAPAGGCQDECCSTP